MAGKPIAIPIRDAVIGSGCPIRARDEITVRFGRGDFGPEQGAKSAHTRLYVSDEQRSYGLKATGRIDTVIQLFHREP